MTSTIGKTCGEEVWNEFSHHVCGRKISPKDPEGKLCGLHLAAKLRREQKDTEYKAALGARNNVQAEIQRIEQGFREHGIKATVVTAGKYPNLTMTGRVEISIEDLRTLIAGQRTDS